MISRAPTPAATELADALAVDVPTPSGESLVARAARSPEEASAPESRSVESAPAELRLDRSDEAAPATPAPTPAPMRVQRTVRTPAAEPPTSFIQSARRLLRAGRAAPEPAVASAPPRREVARVPLALAPAPAQAAAAPVALEPIALEPIAEAATATLQRELMEPGPSAGERLAAATGGLLARAPGQSETVTFAAQPATTAPTPAPTTTASSTAASAAPAPAAPQPAQPPLDHEELYERIIERLRRDLLAERERMGDLLGPRL